MDSDTLVRVFKDMIQLDTSNPEGNERLMTDYIGKVLEAYQIEYQVMEPVNKRASIIASIGPDTEKNPIALISHTDVVPCDGQDWTYPPFAAEEHDGFIYGRGTMDTKHLTAMELAAFIRASQYPLNRKIYYIATADEEQGSSLGMEKVAASYKKELAGSQVINEGGGFHIANGEDTFFTCTVGEKGRCEFHVVIHGDAGPASFISRNKAVTTFAKVLENLNSYQFDQEETAVYLEFMRRVGKDITHPLLKDFAHYISHDAFILSEYHVGTQINVLAHTIEFDLSVQLLPGKTAAYAHAVLDTVFKNLPVEYTMKSFMPGFTSSLNSELFQALDTGIETYEKGARLLPVYALGRTDGRFLGNLQSDVYGFSPVTSAVPFEEVLKLVHQANERIDAASVTNGADLLTDAILEIGKSHA